MSATNLTCAEKYETGNDWLQECTSASAGRSTRCLTFVLAIVHMNAQPEVSTFFCGPKEATIGQARDVIVKYLRDHPERRHLLFARLAIDAMRQAFPCAR
jgi:hypothetical protein